MDDEQAQMNTEIPGFGGLFHDEEGYPTVYLTHPASQAEALEAFGSEVRVLQGAFEFTELQDWRNQLRPTLGLDGVVMLDVDEATNRVRISVEPGRRGWAQAELKRELGRLGIPAKAVIIDEMPAIHPMVTVQQRVRPIPGGVQINFGGFLCTLGFNVAVGSAREFVTNSHCTNIQGGTEGTQYFQPSGGSNFIGTELFDPTYFTGSGCPAGRRCRRSDSARVRYSSTSLPDQGGIARTTSCNSGGGNDFNIAGRYAITGTGNAGVGTTVTKVGRTTGCRRGRVAQTCADVNVSGSNITQLCQTIVTATGPALVGGGDSGSPVFIPSGTNANLVGLLWGGDGPGQVMVFSPINQVLAELF
jgi:hypothetical protein